MFCVFFLTLPNANGKTALYAIPREFETCSVARCAYRRTRRRIIRFRDLRYFTILYVVIEIAADTVVYRRINCEKTLGNESDSSRARARGYYDTHSRNEDASAVHSASRGRLQGSRENEERNNLLLLVVVVVVVVCVRRRRQMNTFSVVLSYGKRRCERGA